MLLLIVRQWNAVRQNEVFPNMTPWIPWRTPMRTMNHTQLLTMLFLLLMTNPSERWEMGCCCCFCLKASAADENCSVWCFLPPPSWLSPPQHSFLYGGRDMWLGWKGHCEMLIFHNLKDKILSQRNSALLLVFQGNKWMTMVAKRKLF